jgi:hypothetical protein
MATLEFSAGNVSLTDGVEIALQLFLDWSHKHEYQISFELVSSIIKPLIDILFDDDESLKNPFCIAEESIRNTMSNASPSPVIEVLEYVSKQYRTGCFPVNRFDRVMVPMIIIVFLCATALLFLWAVDSGVEEHISYSQDICKRINPIVELGSFTSIFSPVTGGIGAIPGTVATFLGNAFLGLTCHAGRALTKIILVDVLMRTSLTLIRDPQLTRGTLEKALTSLIAGGTMFATTGAIIGGQDVQVKLRLLFSALFGQGVAFSPKLLRKCRRCKPMRGALHFLIRSLRSASLVNSANEGIFQRQNAVWGTTRVLLIAARQTFLNPSAIKFSSFTTWLVFFAMTALASSIAMRLNPSSFSAQMGAFVPLTTFVISKLPTVGLGIFTKILEFSFIFSEVEARFENLFFYFLAVDRVLAYLVGLNEIIESSDAGQIVERRRGLPVPLFSGSPADVLVRAMQRATRPVFPPIE